MAKNLTHKILEAHLLEGELIPGKEIAIRIDHTLLQDATGTMAMLEFEELGVETVKAELAVQYVDHNILQTDYKNADDHKYLQTACARYGLISAPPETASPIRSIWNDSGSPARPSWERTATPRARPGFPCWGSEPVGSMWPWPWPVIPIIFPARRCSG